MEEGNYKEYNWVPVERSAGSLRILDVENERPFPFEEEDMCKRKNRVGMNPMDGRGSSSS